MPRLKVGELTFHVQQAGSGPDVVLIHGVTGDLSIWYLCRAMESLATRFRVTAFDLRGHGYTDVPKSAYTSADMAGDVLTLMDKVDAPSAHLVGHSFGGVVAMHAAVLAPDRIDSLILSDPYFPALRHLEQLSRWGHWQNFRQEAEDAGVTLSAEFWYDLGKFFDQVVHLDAEKMLKFRHAVGLPTMNRLMRLGKTTCGDDVKEEAGLTTEKIHAVHVPTLALYGEFSPFLATADYLSEHLSDCRSELVPLAQHRAPEENPVAFLAAVERFLVEVTTRSLAESSR